jgi:cation diffusion facilitator family transporter
MQPDFTFPQAQTHDSGPADNRRERGLRAVIGLTVVTMLLEVGAGYWTGSMALLADGWHMATHVAALGLSAVAYVAARRFASHRAFAFGTGKVHALAGYTSAVALGLVAAEMVVESVRRVLSPEFIDFASSLPVAVVGLVVNLLSVKLLYVGAGEHDHDSHHHAHEHHDHAQGSHPEPDHLLAAHAHAGHDHNYRAAVLHVVADTFTSVIAIAALLAGRFLGWVWLDPLTGILGGMVILVWGASLCRNASLELLNVDPAAQLSDSIRTVVEGMENVRVSELRIWPLGRGARGCVMTLIADSPRDVTEYRQRVLRSFPLAHLTIELHHRGPATAGQSSEA